MWGVLLRFFKSWRLVLGLSCVLTIILFSFHYFSLQGDNESLSNLVEQKEREVQSLRKQNEKQNQEYNALDKSLSQYQKSLKLKGKQNKELSRSLTKAGDDDDELKKCLNTNLPDDILSRLRN